MIATLAKALLAAEAFRRGAYSAIQLETALLDLGFHSVEFSPPAAKYLGVRYTLEALA